jgi:hypothetical protein
MLHFEICGHLIAFTKRKLHKYKLHIPVLTTETNLATNNYNL